MLKTILQPDVKFYKDASEKLNQDIFLIQMKRTEIGFARFDIKMRKLNNSYASFITRLTKLANNKYKTITNNLI